MTCGIWIIAVLLSEAVRQLTGNSAKGAIAALLLLAAAELLSIACSAKRQDKSPVIDQPHNEGR